MGASRIIRRMLAAARPPAAALRLAAALLPAAAICLASIAPATAAAAGADEAGGPGAPGGRPNHLQGETSPYLLQHLYNPVDWYPWGDEALARARREDRPIFLSIGYSACHWCHVMEREAFSDLEIARLLGEHFVAIKVDREERPDLDDIYMTAVVAMTGSGGWPLSAFLTPDLKPFYGGTYFPKDRFREVLLSVAGAWRERRQEILASASRLHEAVRLRSLGPAAGAVAAASPDPAAALARAAAALKARFDRENGGFGGAPKFPPHGALWLLLEAHRERGDDQALDMAARTLDAMARGGLYDQLGGGFHRYATDARWRLPHFEKMLYDNALLVPLYLEAWQRTGRAEFRQVAEETLAWARREMTGPGGGFLASLDADSEGEEGRYYLWTAAEVRAALGAREAGPAIDWYGISEPGDLAGGRNVLHRPRTLEQVARRQGIAEPALRERLQAARRRLLEARARRPRPPLDDKVLASWNGLMISALARAYAATGEPSHRDAAEAAARFVLANLGDRDGRLRVSWRRGKAGPPGYLDDYAFMARGLLDLHAATGEPAWLEAAARLVRQAERFRDPLAGGYFFTAAEHRDLIVRGKSLEDSALPSGNAVLTECQLRLAGLRGDGALRDAAARTLALAGPALIESPSSYAYLILAARAPTGEGRPGLVPPPRPATARAAAARVAALGAPRVLPVAGGLVAVAQAAEPSAAGTAAGVPAGAAAGARDRVVKGTVVGRPSPQRVVESSLGVAARPVRPGEAVTLSVLLDIKEGWHVNSSTPTLDYLIATRLEFPDDASVVVDQIAYPEGKMVTLKFAKERLSVYEGRNTLRATIRPPADAPAGAREVRARLTYQACSNTACLAPETVEFKVPLTVDGPPVEGAPTASAAPGAAPPAALGRKDADRVAALLAEHGLPWAMCVVFVWGLALNLTPCVYPMIPVTIGFFANQAAGGGWGRRVALPALYVLGMALTYSALGVAAGLSGGMFGSTLQNPWIVGTLVLLFIAMALWMFGLYEVRLPSALMSVGGGRRGAAGALLMGMTMGIVAAPCIGPFVVALLAFVGATGDPVLGFWLFFILAIGMGVPNLVLGTFSGALASLPRSGVWLIYAKKVMGVALLAVALYFTQPFLSDRTLGIVVLAFAAVAGLYLGLLDRTRVAARWFLPLKVATGLVVFTCGTWFALPLVSARAHVDWAPYSEETLAAARQSGRPVLIDFFAEWCPPCKELDRFTFTDPKVLEEAERFRLIKVDVTSFESDAVREVRERYDVIGVPTIVFIDRQGSEVHELRLYGFEEPEAFLARMRQVR
jgi:hypothetical protein